MVKVKKQKKTEVAVSVAKHRMELKRSSLTRKDWEGAEVFSEVQADKVALYLGYRLGASWMAPALCFPYFDLDGNILTYDRDGNDFPYIRLKPNEPQTNSAGHVKKYLGPIGAPQNCYVPPSVGKVKDEVEIDLWITEGEKKALCAVAVGGVACIGLPGVWGWKEAGVEELGPLMSKFDYRDRTCIICFDSDIMENDGVKLASERLADALYKRGCSKVLLSIPPTKKAKDGRELKQGLDDYLSAGGSMDDLLLSAEVMKKKGGTGTITIEWLSDITPEKTEWLWDKWIPKGELTIFDGQPGIGKSQITLDLIARLTNGTPMPPYEGCWNGNKTGKGINVAVMAAEDSKSKTIVTRAIACGADRSMIGILGKPEAGEYIQLPSDIGLLEGIMRESDCEVLIIDPFMSFVEGRIDTHSDASSRRLLSPLSGLAEKTGISILGIRHHNKKSGESAMNRGSGSIAFSATARSVFMVGEVEGDDGEQMKVLASVKSNLGPKPEAMEYTLEAVDNEWGGTSRVRWLGHVDLDSHDLVGSTSTGKDRSGKARTAVEKALESGPMKSVLLTRAVVKESGASEKTIKNVMKSMGIVKKQKDRIWWARLPGDKFEWEK